MLQLSTCPVCLKNDLEQYLAAADHTVSHETFSLDKCSNCGFVLTNPRPDDEHLPDYYKSDAYISHSNKSTGLIDKIYKISRHFTLKWKYDIIQQHSHKRPTSVLDFGCGTGAFIEECKKHNLAVTGIEPAEIARTQAAKNTNTTIYAQPTEVTGAYDVITAWHVLEHVPNFHESLRTLSALLTDHGTLFIAVPNLLSYDARHYRELWAGYDVPRHLWHFSHSTMETIAAQHALKLIATVPMKLDAYYVSLLSEKYKRGKNVVTNMALAIINGWKSNRLAKSTGEYSSIIYILRK